MNDGSLFHACPDHGDLVAELARGALSPEASAEAEAVLERCAACSVWLDGLLEGRHDVLVGVEAGFAAFRSPRRRWRTLVEGLVAVLVLAAGIGAVWHSVAAQHRVRELPAAQRLADGTQQPAVNGKRTVTARKEGSTVLFQNSLESGTLSGWVVRQ